MDLDASLSGQDEYRPSESVTNEELIAVIEGRSQMIDSIDALHELSLRRPSGWDQLLIETAGNHDRPADLRGAAAFQLGRENTEMNRRALEGALDAEEAGVQRRVVEALGCIGDEQTLDRLNSFTPSDEVTRNRLGFARTLIAYRLGLEVHRLAAQPRLLNQEFETARAIPLGIDSLEARDLGETVDELQPEIPAISISSEGAFELTCDGGRFRVLFTREVHQGKMLETFERRSGVLAVVAEYSESLHRYSLSEYILAHPQRGGNLEVFGSRPTGALLHYGEVQLDEATATFRIRSVDSPFTPAAVMDGSIDRIGRQPRFTQALVAREDTRRRNQSIAPKRLSPPD
jgi:hypothetical protein